MYGWNSELSTLDIHFHLLMEYRIFFIQAGEKMSLEFCQVISFYLSASTRLPWSVTGTSYPHVPSVCSDIFFDDFQDFCFRVLGFISPFNTFNEAIRKLLPCYGSVLVEFNPSAAGSCSSNSCEKLHASMGTEGE